jgi:hypothetical protein
VAQWFGDVDRLGPRQSFEFRMGDGDFFRGRITRWKQPALLRLEWRFLGIGPRFEITHRIDPAPNQHSILTTADQGAPTAAYARSLADGWNDFHDRLERFLYTGQSARFDWSPVFEATVILRRARHDGRPAELDSVEWLQAVFPDAALAAQHDGTWILHEPSWGSARTRAGFRVEPSALGTVLSVAHDGWSALPEPQRLVERRRYAALWQRALERLERAYE